MSNRRVFAVSALLASATLLGGCVVGQSLPANYEAGPAVAAKAVAVTATVHDERPYVKSGDKPPYFIGKYRAGFGNPWDVTTQDKQPLASLLQRDLAKELQALGYAVAVPGGAARTLDVAIRDWNFDAYINGKFWYVLDIRVFGRDGQELVKTTVEEAQHIEGSFWTGAKGAFEEKMPELYAGAVRKLVRENATVSAALVAEQSGQLRSTNISAAAPATPPPAGRSAEAKDSYTELLKLDELRQKKIITQDEFDAQKKILAG